MTKFRALVIAGVLALTFNFVGCFDHGEECPEQAGVVLTGGQVCDL